MGISLDPAMDRLRSTGFDQDQLALSRIGTTATERSSLSSFTSASAWQRQAWPWRCWSPAVRSRPPVQLGVSGQNLQNLTHSKARESRRAAFLPLRPISAAINQAAERLIFIPCTASRAPAPWPEPRQGQQNPQAWPALKGAKRVRRLGPDPGRSPHQPFREADRG